MTNTSNRATPSGGASGSKNFRVIQNLATGANVIVHGLALSSPFSTITSVRIDLDGSDVAVSVVAEAANSLTINSSSPITNARITIIA